MNPQYLPATARDDVPAWQQTVVAFLAEKERRSGSRRTVEGYARMLWPFLNRVGSPDFVTPAHVLAWAHGTGASGREPSSATVGARIARLSSYFRFLVRMGIATGNPCDALERPRTVQSVARGSERRRGSSPVGGHPGHRGRSPGPGALAHVRPHGPTSWWSGAATACVRGAVRHAGRRRADSPGHGERRDRRDPDSDRAASTTRRSPRSSGSTAHTSLGRMSSRSPGSAERETRRRGS